MIDNNLSADAITADLTTKFIGQNIIHLPTVTSTMDIARREAKKRAAEGTLIIADAQTMGRGRLKRVWLSPPGSSIAMSLILYPETKMLPFLIMIASLAVIRCLKKVTGLDAEIKWPNDVLIKGKKVCGILIENQLRANKTTYSIIGIGINVNLRVTDFPDIAGAATSLSEELGSYVSRLNVIRQLLIEIEALYRALSQENTIYQEWRDNLVTLGKRVRVTSEKTIHEGVAESVFPDGSLLLRYPDGTSTRIVASDVTLRE